MQYTLIIIIMYVYACGQTLALLQQIFCFYLCIHTYTRILDYIDSYIRTYLTKKKKKLQNHGIKRHLSVSL